VAAISSAYRHENSGLGESNLLLALNKTFEGWGEIMADDAAAMATLGS